MNTNQDSVDKSPSLFSDSLGQPGNMRILNLVM